MIKTKVITTDSVEDFEREVSQIYNMYYVIDYQFHPLMYSNGDLIRYIATVIYDSSKFVNIHKNNSGNTGSSISSGKTQSITDLFDSLG